MRYLAAALCLLVCVHGDQIQIIPLQERGRDGFLYSFFGTRIRFQSDRFANVCTENGLACASPKTFEMGAFVLDVMDPDNVERRVLRSSKSLPTYPDLSYPFRIVSVPMTVTVATVAGGVRLRVKWDFLSAGIASVFYDRLRLYHQPSGRMLTWAIHSGYTDGRDSALTDITSKAERDWIVPFSQVVPMYIYQLQFTQHKVSDDYWADIPDRQIMFVGGENFWFYGKSPNWIQAPNA